jgi:hypothetical protein
MPPKYLSLWLFTALLLCHLSAAAQEPMPEPMPMADPLRPQRVKLRAAWQALGESASKEADPRSRLIAAWALFHEYDVDYFTLLEGDAGELLTAYDQRCIALRKKLAKDREKNELFDLADAELAALQDDIEANRLQNARPEQATNDAPELKAWHEKFEKFQIARVAALHERGKQIVGLFRAGEVDALRPCVALLERQIAERVLVEHQEMFAPPAAASKFAAERKSLLKRQHGEWKKMHDLLQEEKPQPQSIVAVGTRVCFLHQRTIDLLTARLAADAVQGDEATVKEAQAPVADLTRRVFKAYRDLHRSGVELHGEAAMTVEQLARLHDLRMYTTIWSDPALDPADVLADGVEVSEMWTKLHAALAKSSPDSRDTQIALAKRWEAEIALAERQPAEMTRPAEASKDAAK